MLSYLRDERFAVICVADCEQLGVWERACSRPIAYVEKNFAVQYLSLLFQSLIGATFKRRFAYFIGANVVVAAVILLAAFVYLIR